MRARVRACMRVDVHMKRGLRFSLIACCADQEPTGREAGLLWLAELDAAAAAAADSGWERRGGVGERTC